jgi:hypothetical protein
MLCLTELQADKFMQVPFRKFKVFENLPEKPATWKYSSEIWNKHLCACRTESISHLALFIYRVSGAREAKHEGFAGRISKSGKGMQAHRWYAT